MKASRTVADDTRYVVTEQGRQDVASLDTCACRPHLAGLLIECAECGTVYGSVRESMNWGKGYAERKR